MIYLNGTLQEQVVGFKLGQLSRIQVSADQLTSTRV